MFSPITKNEACAILQSVSADCIWLLNEIESNRGWLEFPLELSRYVQYLGVSDYPKLYENEQLLTIVTIRSLFSAQEFKHKMEAFEVSGGRDRELLLREFIRDVDDAVGAAELPKSSDAVRGALELFNSLGDDARAEALTRARCFMAGFLASFHQMLAVMIHGEKITALVARAKAGDVQAFLKAVQVDGRVLAHVPFFRDLHASAISSGDKLFLRAIGRRAAAPPYKGRIRRKALWMGMSVLDEIGVLRTFSHREILDVFDQSGLNEGPDRVEDVTALTKMIVSFRKFQKNGGMSMQ